MKDRISVICPAWQAADTLQETLASIRAQTLSPLEVVVVDDGSSDLTSEIALSNGASLVRQEKRGVSAALNNGVTHSTGELLAFIDADDLWPSDKLALQVGIIERDASLGGVLGRHRRFPDPSPGAEPHLMQDDPAPAWLTGALLTRRSVFEEVGPFDESLPAGHAIDWFDRARRAGVRFAIPDAVVLLRRIRPGSLSHRSKERDSGYARMALKAIQRRRADGGT